MIDQAPVGIAGNDSSSVRVRVTADGTLDDLHIERSELRYGGAALAQTILRLYGEALSIAVAARRAEFARRGITDDILDRAVPSAVSP